MAATLNEDLLDTYKQYGVIQNSQVKVRTAICYTNPTVLDTDISPPSVAPCVLNPQHLLLQNPKLNQPNPCLHLPRLLPNPPPKLLPLRPNPPQIHHSLRLKLLPNPLLPQRPYLSSAKAQAYSKHLPKPDPRRRARPQKAPPNLRPQQSRLRTKMVRIILIGH